MPKKLFYAIPDPGCLSPGSISILRSFAVTAAITKKVKATKIFIFYEINSYSQCSLLSVNFENDQMSQPDPLFYTIIVCRLNTKLWNILVIELLTLFQKNKSSQTLYFWYDKMKCVKVTRSCHFQKIIMIVKLVAKNKSYTNKDRPLKLSSFGVVKFIYLKCCHSY